MEKYKCILEYPGGPVINSVYTLQGTWYRGYSGEFHQDNVEGNPKYFAEYVFTTEDCVDIFIGDKYYYIIDNRSTILYSVCGILSGNNENKQFSTAEKAQEYLDSKKVPEWVVCIGDYFDWYLKNKVYEVLKKSDKVLDEGNLGSIQYSNTALFREATKAEVEAHLKGFHIGDKIWYTSGRPTFIGTIHTIKYSEANGIYFGCKDLCNMFFPKGVTNKEPVPKIITEEGDKLYGADRCYLIFNTSNFIGNLKDYTGEGTHERKYFSKKENAEKYLAELKGSDFDINKTCGTCEFELDYELTGYPCSTCTLNSELDCNWKAKKLQFEVGKWYKSKVMGSIVIYLGNGFGNGFISGNVDKWREGINISNVSEWSIITISTQPIKKLLLEKAKKDYPVGTKFKNMLQGVVQEVDDANHSVGIKGIFCGRTVDNMWSNNGGNSNAGIYNNGKWAEIIKEPKLTLGKYDVTLDNDCVSTTEGKVRFEDWIPWFKKVDWFYENAVLGYMGLSLQSFDKKEVYNTVSTTGMYTNIGCIGNITYKQLKAITDKINEESK